MREQRRSMMVMEFFAVLLAMTLFLPGLTKAGQLEPPGPPGPTMHTLDEIYNLLIEEIGVVPKTGQTNSYAPGDDGDLEMGVSWPSPRFTDNGDNTVTDNLTRLMWTKNANLASTPMLWSDAVNYCNNLDFAGRADWRLPNVRELQSLIDYGRCGPALPSGHPFVNVQSVGYWSATTRADSAASAWGVFMSYGGVYNYGKVGSNYVWCVRGGN